MKFIGKLFKKLFATIFLILFIAVVLVVILYLSAGKLVQHFAPDFISQVTKTETTLGEVDVSLFSGRLAINNLTIGNPAGFKDKNAFQLGHISVLFDPKSVLSDKIIVNNVLIKGVQVSTELNAQGKTNVAELLNNVQQSVGTDASATPEQGSQQAPVAKQTPQKESQKTVVIRDLKIQDSSVRTGVAGQMIDIPLPEIHQTNIGENKKQTLADVALLILNTVNAESTKAILQATQKALTDNIQNGKDTIQNIKDTLKNLF